MGRGDNKTAEKIMANCFTLLLILAVVLTAVFYLAAPSLLVLFGASANTLPFALDYARIYVLGSVFVLIVLGMNPFVTTQGFAAFSMLTTVIGAVCNIILDPIFIFVLNMGVKGAATATIISQAVGALWVLKFLTGKRTKLKLRAKDMPLQRRIILPCLGAGRVHLCNDRHREHSVHQLQLESCALRRGSGRGRYDHHHQRIPASVHAAAGYLSGRPAR